MGWNHFSHVTNNEFYAGKTIEHAVDAETQSVSLEIDSELQCSHAKRNTVIVEFLLDMGWWNARMHVDNRIEFLDGSPEWIVLRLIVQQHLLAILSSRLEVIDPEIRAD
jgi:hypothetical protein